MKVRIYDPAKDGEKTITIPTGFLFSKVGMYFMAKLTALQARKDYDKKMESLWKADMDDLLTPEDVQKAERLAPPISQDQAMELFTALKNSKYLMHGLPLVSIEHADGSRVRIDL